MKSSVWEKAERFLRERKDYKRWLAVVACLAVLVTLGTVAALKSTGSAMTHKQEVLNCRYEVHKHTQACYDAEGKLICGYADVAIHQHNDDCYDAEGKLVCTLPEVKLHKQHEAPCYTEQSELVCGLTEGEDHTHSDSCYTRNELLTCTQIAQDLHTHDGNCYDAEGRLICGLLQLEEHVHNADCIETVELNNEEVAALNEQNASGEDETSSEVEESATAETTGSTEMTEGYEPVVLTQTAETENYVVTVSYTAEANIPENAVLQVIEYARDSERFLQRAEELGYEPDWLLNIGFYVDGVEIEPAAQVTVKVVMKGQEEVSDYEIVHFTDDGQEELDGLGVEDENGAATEFVADRFSDFSGITWSIDGPNTVKVGESIKLTTSSRDYTWNHNWKSSDTNIATTANGSKAGVTVTGKSAGPVTITHTWWGYYGDYYEEHYTVTVTAVSSENSGSDIGGSGLQEVAPVSGLVHEKYVKANEDGTYELTLNVKGAVASATDKAKLDIVFVLDTSGSMAWGVNGKDDTSTSRREKANQSITNLINVLDASDSGIDAKYKLVTFSGSASMKVASWSSGTEIISKLPSSASGATNYEDALKKAGTAVSSGARSGSKTIVIFLTDGCPTVCKSDDNSGGTTNDADITGAENGASKITCDYFFAIGYGSEMTSGSTVDKTGLTAKQILDKVAAKVSASEGKDVSATTDISGYFSKFIASLTTIHAVNVSFTDQLTDEVSIVTTAETPSEADWVIKITDKNGNDVTETEKTVSGMTVSYDSVTKRVNVSFNQSYELKKDYTYSITTKIQPNDAASALYASNNYTYPHLGDANTDAPGNATSSNKYGIYCNVDNSAKVNYSYIINDGTPVVHDPLDYPRPVVQFQTAPVKPPQVDQKMSHNKYVEKVDDNTDTYNLTLDVAGQVGSVNQKAKYDIMFVVDTSSSMKNKDGGRKARIDQAKDAIIQLIDNLDRETSTIDARYNLVSFGSTASNPVGWKSGDAIKNTINGLSTNGGTNYQQGLAKAAAGMSESRLDATAVVIFMTDGQPTWHVCKPVQASSNKHHTDSTDKLSNDGGACRGGGSYTTKTDYEGALMGAGAVSCNYFYAVGFGDTMNSTDKVYESYTAFDIISKVAQATNATIKKPTVTTDLATYFEGVLSDLQKFYCTNVTVTDTLSQWAEVSDPQNAMLKIAITDKDGNVIRTEQGTVASGVTMTLPSTDVNKNPGSVTATYSSGEKKIVLQFPTSYQLEEGYTYSVTVEIKPTQKAYEYYVTENGYPHTGDLITDKPGLDESQYISSGKKGFYSNDSAVVTYSYNGGSGQESYLDPVITVTPATLNITKTVEGLTDSQKEELLKQLKFTVDTNNSIQVNAVTNSDNTVSYVYSELVVPNVSHSVAEQTDTAYVSGYDCTTSSTVSVDDGNPTETADGINASVTLQPGSEATVAYTNNYVLHTETIQLTKMDENGANVKDVEFTLTEVTENTDKITYTLKTDSDGKAYYLDGTEKKTSIVLPAGVYLVTETAAPAKYIRIQPFQIKVTSSGVILESENNNVEVKAPVDEIIEIAVTNSIATLDELQILKVSADGGITPLQGAKFTLYNIDPNTIFEEGDSLDKHIVVSDLTTDQNGVASHDTLNNLSAGDYWLVENMAPNGYKLLTTAVAIQVYYDSDDGRTEVRLTEIQSGSEVMEQVTSEGKTIWTVKVPNNTGAELPMTGGPGTILYTLGGIAILAIGLLYGFSMRRMRERRFK